MRLKIRVLLFLVSLGIFGGGLPAVASLSYCFTSGTQVATSGSNYVASGSLSLSLGFAPTPGTNLTVIKNTGVPFISGTFDNVPQGGTVTLTYDGISYNYVANYYGGNGRSFVLQWPNTGLAAWGNNQYGVLGNGNTTSSWVPVAVNTSGLLSGKTIVAVAEGEAHALALTSDGKVFSWGSNIAGGLGDGSTTDSSVPVAVNSTGALKGKTVVAIAAGNAYSLALTSDGQVFAWGFNSVGQLGNGSTTNSSVPVAVTGLTGKSIVAISAGFAHALALTSDGKVYSWGYNNCSQLGRSSTTNSSTAGIIASCLVSGTLGGKIVTAISAGTYHSMALDSDGNVYSWGSNQSGQLGNNNVGSYTLDAVALDTSGVLKGKSVVAIAASGVSTSIAGFSFSSSLALASDGAVYAWGGNDCGQLGNNSTKSSVVPVAVTSSGALAGKTVIAISAGNGQCMAVTSDKQVFTWGKNDSGQLGNDSIAGIYNSVPVAVNTDGELAAGTSEAASAKGSCLVIFGMGAPSVTANPINQLTASGTAAIFTATTTYKPAPSIKWQVCTTGTAGNFSDISGNATATTGTLRLTNVSRSMSGYAYRAVFTNTFGTATTSPATLAVDAVFNAPTDVPMTSSQVSVSGSLPVTLGFSPTPGANLTVIKNTGSNFIDGTFSNMPQGGTIQLSYGGISYSYVVNYYGGSGRSLVLQWPYTKIAAWGSCGSNINSIVPVAMATNGVLDGKTVTTVATGGTQTLALTADGGIYVMGSASTLLNTGTAMAGKTVISIAAGTSHCMALTSDGQVFCWGANSRGQLGNGDNTDSAVPVAVSSTGALSGKTVTAIAAGDSHSLALTSDGQVFSWGANSSGQLGNNSTTNSSVPVAVSSTGALAGKAVTLVAAGNTHSMALTSDGQVCCWGYNHYGQLGNNSTTNSSVPVAVSSTGVLTGKTVSLIAAGASHCMALTSDNHVVAWGCNLCGQLGNKSTTSGSVPVAVNALWENSGKTAGAIAGGGNHSLICTTDGSVYAWGYAMYGQLGNNSRSDSSVPVAVTTGTSSALNNNATIICGGFNSSLALFAWSPQAPIVTSHPVSTTGTYGSSISFTAGASSDLPASVKWQVSSTGTSGAFIDIKDNPSATTTTLTTVASQNGCAYRAVFTSDVGTGISNPATLTLLPTFDLFQSQNGLQGSGPNEDPYHTGISNLVAYAFGITPSAPDRTQLPSADLQNNYLQISYSRRKNAADLGYVVEVSSDLKTWYSGSSYTAQISVTPIDDTRDQIIERDLIPTSSEPRRFIRVRITH